MSCMIFSKYTLVSIYIKKSEAKVRTYLNIALRSNGGLPQDKSKYYPNLEQNLIRFRDIFHICIKSGAWLDILKGNSINYSLLHLLSHPLSDIPF